MEYRHDAMQATHRPTPRRRHLMLPRILLVSLAGAALAVACSAPAASPSTSPGPTAAPASGGPDATASPGAPTPVPPSGFTLVPSPDTGAGPAPASPPRTAEDAAALVIASDPRFAGVRPLDHNLIGQSSWYEVHQGLVGWVVTITQGSGDCQAGCINKHTWTYSVDPAGHVTMISEGGDPVDGGPGASGTGGSVGGGTGGVAQPSPDIPAPAGQGPWLVGYASAGPVCPVERNPPDPSCAPRPVASADVVVQAMDGTEVARTTTDAAGIFRVNVPAGKYLLVAQPAAGIMGTPAAIPVTVLGDAAPVTRVDLSYDTGIR